MDVRAADRGRRDRTPAGRCRRVRAGRGEVRAQGPGRDRRAVFGEVSIVEDARVDRRDFKTEDRRQDDGQNWVFSRPVDGLAGPTIGQVDIRDQARNYVKQRLVSEILSKTALGRGLSVFVDTGKTEIDPSRSRLLPYISPKVSAREGGKAAITFTWKF